MTNIIASLIQSIRSAAKYNPDVQAAPACILWPDHSRQWEAVVPRLQEELPELVVLGSYSPEKRTGPAIWLRCVVARRIEDLLLPLERLPIIYLPGISRQDLRAVDSCPEFLKPLAELQYRGAVWSQISSKDWTILMFLKSDQGGLGLDVATDKETKNAMQLALFRLLDEEVEHLKGKRLDRDFFNTLITGDSQRNILQWLDQEIAFRKSRGDNEWQAFVEVCKSQLAFSPEEEGVLAGAAKLAEHIGPWQPVWERFCEAPRLYQNIPDLIRKCRPPRGTLSWHTGGSIVEGWPQWNEEQEIMLRKDLEVLSNLPPHEARKKISDLEKQHGSRRALVWAKLGLAPLARALQHLSALAETTASSLAAGTIDDLAAGYRITGWRADDSVMRALAFIKSHEDFEAVKTAIRVVYLPWAEESARYLQKLVDESGYPGESAASRKSSQRRDGECILFVDGLRFDAAKRLADQLTKKGFQVEERIVWAALPTVTATGKPAVAPVCDKISGSDDTIDFEPNVAKSGQSLKGGYYLKRLLKDSGWEIIERSSNGRRKEMGSAWCEVGDIDDEGHIRGWKLAMHLDGILGDIQDRATQLLGAGWKNVRVVTDHGWLLMPGGLSKIELPGALTENKWGRCAAIKPGATTKERLYPWYWNQSRHFALADGISCFREGKEYDHGGLSLQECLTLELNITSGSSTELDISDVVWKRLRCTVAVDGNFDGLSVDIRTNPGDPSSSVVLSKKTLNDSGTASVVVENEDLEGSSATLVLLDRNGSLVAQLDTVIGGSAE